MLDLNLEADSACDETETDPCKTAASAICGDDSGTSVTASSSDDSNSSSHTLTDGGCNSLCTLNFSILKSDQVIEAGEESNGEDLAVTEQLVPVAGKSLSPTVEAAPPPSQSWLNLSVPESGCKPPWMQQPHQPVKKTRRGPRSRSSQYRGVTFYRRTGRWESHIWDCGKQIYLGGFDTAHFAARAYDRAALKFRGVDADINFHISDYEEDMKQMKNLTKEEFIQTLRHQSAGFSKRSSRYRGVTLHKCGRWEAQIGQFLGKRTYDKAAINCNQQDNQHMDAGGGDSLDPNHWISPPPGGLKGPDNTRKLEFNFGVHETPVLKRVNVFFTNAYPSRFSHDSSYIAVDSSPATPRGPAMASKYSIWTGMHSGIIPNTQERLMGMRAEKTPAPAFSNWQWKMQSQGVVTSSVPLYSSAASSGFSSTTTPLTHP